MTPGKPLHSPLPNPIPQAGEGTSEQSPPLLSAGEGTSDQPPPLPLAGEGRGEGKTRKRRRTTLRARTLRRNQTDAEKIIWHELKAKRFQGLKFKRQHPVGPYFADFICIEKKLIVEIDGGQHCGNAADEARTDFMTQKGYEVVRFWNNDVLQNTQGVLEALFLALFPQAGTP
ncbi:MAG: DUF559 domain-containing protein [Alphaproteobacteria bacterium]|nr:DUF559 domain-containing protein [Alphaproteobacteria bacterium]